MEGAQAGEVQGPRWGRWPARGTPAKCPCPLPTNVQGVPRSPPPLLPLGLVVTKTLGWELGGPFLPSLGSWRRGSFLQHWPACMIHAISDITPVWSQSNLW
jgi:hypothetical protein